MQVSLVAPAHVSQIWPKVEPHLARVFPLVAETHHPVDIWERARSGDLFLWAVHEGDAVTAAIVTQVTNYPRLRAYGVFLLGGDGMPQWIAQVNAALEAHGRALGCKRIEYAGRPGWARTSGYEITGCIAKKDL